MTAIISTDMTAAQYHADPAPEPSLSASIAKVLLDQSPLHAFHCHPRLGLKAEDGESEPTRQKEIGTAAHKLLIGRGAEVVAIDAADYKSGKAKALRAEAYAAGHAPVLAPDLAIAEAMVKAARDQLAGIPAMSRAFTKGAGEVVIQWKDRRGPWCRVMIDWLSEDAAEICDYKTTGQSAAPQGLGRTIANMGYEVQAALQEMAVCELYPQLAGRIRYRWLFQETSPPYLIVPVELNNTGREIGRRKVAAAIHLWHRCLTSGHWPGYPQEVVQAEYPPWLATMWEQREMDDPSLASADFDTASLARVLRRPSADLMEIAP